MIETATFDRMSKPHKPEKPRQDKPEKPHQADADASERDEYVLFIRLDAQTEAALQAFMAAQPFKPQRQEIGIKALYQLLERHGFWPPKKKS